MKTSARSLTLALLFPLLATCLKVSAGETAMKAAIDASRPVLPVFTTAEQVDAFCTQGLTETHTAIERFAAQPDLRTWDAIDIALGDLGGPIAIASATAPAKPVREAAEACELKLSALQTQMLQRSDLYDALKQVTTRDAIDTQVKTVSLEGFEDAGVNLAQEQRARAKTLFDELDALGIEFQRNTRENLATVTMQPAELEGLPKSYLDAHPANEHGIVTLKLNYPDYVPFMDNAVSSEARRRYFMAFNQIGGPRNIEILNRASALRKELATLFGKPSFAEHVIARRMAGSAGNVERFLASIKDKVQAVEQRDLDILRQAKSELLRRPLDEVKIERWDTGYYIDRVRRTKYAVDQNALRRYFPTEAAIDWLFDLAQRMYGVRFVRQSVPAWHDDVRYYDILNERGERIAGAYLDPFPREGKYNHAAVWPVRGTSTLIGRTPISVLVTNLDRTGLSHDELETLLHEFGHLLHGTLSRTRYHSLSGTSVRRDFVEAPSQMFEEWARHPETLRLIKSHCRDCPAVDAALVRRLVDAKHFAAGIHYTRQHILARFDMAMAGPEPGDAMDTFRQLEASSPLGHTPGTLFPARFGHLLGGYAAGYYGYMWSEVLALDMASVWRGRLLDPKVSRRYRDTVLAKGGEVSAEKMVRDFLGRAPSSEPFFAEITGRARKGGK